MSKTTFADMHERINVIRDNRRTGRASTQKTRVVGPYIPNRNRGLF